MHVCVPWLQKSNMQGLLGRSYTSSAHCAGTIYTAEGVRGLYKGSWQPPVPWACCRPSTLATSPLPVLHPYHLPFFVGLAATCPWWWCTMLRLLHTPPTSFTPLPASTPTPCSGMSMRVIRVFFETAITFALYERLSAMLRES